MQILKLFFCAIFMASIFILSTSAHAAGGEKKAEGESSILFVELSPLILPIVNEYGVTQVISLVVAIEVDSQEKADKVTKFQPRLTDAYLSDLYGAFSHQAPKNGIIPIAFLKKRLNMMSAKVLGEHVVSDVLVQVMQNRPV